MLSTAIGVQFNVNDLEANYEVVGTSDNYSFQYNLGKGSDIASFEGEAIQKIISLEGNYGEFDIRVFAASDIGVRSEFIESGISISPPRFENTFTFANLRIENLPENANIGSVNLYEPQYPGDKLEVESEYVNRNVKISWSLIPPVGHAKEGQTVTTELLNDSFFERFSITLENGSGAQVIDNQVLANSVGMQDTLLTADVTGLLNEYRDFSLTLNEASFQDIDFDRTLGVKIVSHDSFGRTATGVLTGINYSPQVEGLSYALRGSDMSFSWFSNDTDFSGVSIQSLAIPSDKSLIYPQDLQSSYEYYQELNSAESWNFGRSEYRSGDMATYSDSVYRAKTDINKSLIDDLGRQNTNPSNTDLWENVGEKFDYQFNQQDVFEESYSTYQVWGYSYYYTFQAIDGYGSSDVYNLTDFGLALNRNLKAFTSEVKIGALRYREQEDDLIFNWDVVDQDGTLVDLDKYRFALTNSDVPSVLGLSGSLFDSETKEFLTGITEGNTSKISTVDEFGNRKVLYDLPNTEVFNTYEFTREINNQIYGTGGFLTNYEIFNASTIYVVADNVADSNKNIFTALLDTDYQNNEPYIRPFYTPWQSSETYAQDDIIEYAGDLYKLKQEFGPDSDNVLGIFDTGVNYNSGDLVIYPDANISPYFTNQEYLAGDVVLFDQTFYLALQNQAAEDNYFPNQYKRYWQNISVFDNLNAVIYKAKSGINSSIQNPYVSADSWQPQRPNNSEYFSKHVSGFNLSCDPWSNSLSYNPGALVLYANDIWSGIKNNGPIYDDIQQPSSSSTYWTNVDANGQDIVSDYNLGDLVYYSGAVYKCLSDTPNAAPMPAVLNFGDSIASDYLACDWIPFWEKNTSYDGFVYGHIGIPESGKRSVGLEVGIIDNKGEVLNSQKIIGINQEPSILSNGFQVDSLSETTKVKFNFNYAFSSQEKTTKVNLYRSSEPNFEITGSDGLPYDTIGGDSTLVKVTLGAADATFGENITQIVDSPPIPKIDGIDKITGYYYKILPFDDFGSGDLYGVNDNAGNLERCLVYPRNYSNKNPNGVGAVFRTSADDIPGPVKNLDIETAFENFFISWNHPSGEIVTNSPSDNSIEYTFNDNIPNDLSHYEVWMSTDSKLELGSLGSDVFLKSERDPFEDVDFSNNKGYRRIEGNIPSVISDSEPIPIELQDPASGITNAKRIFNVPANGPEIETSYLGKTNETKYFWVRPVDFAGNKGPFTGAADLGGGQEILGFEATLGQASATDIDDFELNMTEIFGNTIALAPQPDPFDGDGSYVSWPQHVLYYQGTGYLINGSGVGPNYDTQRASYIWWDNDNQAESADPDQEYVNVGLRNIYYKNVNYKVSNSHPAGSREQDSANQDYIDPDPNFGEGDFIVARLAGFPSNAAATPVYHAFANALIGTANIAEAAIVDAKINTLTADKITAGEIKGHEIKVGFGVTNEQTDTAKIGSISSVDFNDLVFDETFPQILNPNISGFSLKADGTFAFQAGSSSLSYENDVLMLRGRMKQTNNKDYDFIELDCTPNYFNYVENEDGYFISDDNVDSYIDITFRNTSIDDVSNIQLRATAVNDGGEAQLFDFNDINLLDGTAGKFGFEYVADSFEVDSESSTVTARVKITADGFDSGLSTINNADSIAIYIKGKNSTHQKKTTISRIIDGKAAESIRLSATSQTFKVDKYGSIIGENEITITADVQNTSKGIQWTSNVDGIKIYDINGNEISETINGSPNYTQNKTVKIKFNDFPESQLTVKISAATEAGTVSPSVSDEMTFIVVEDGSNEVSAILSNENHTFTETYNSSTGTYSLDSTNSGTDIEVFDGAQLLTPKSETDYGSLEDKAGYYYVAASSSAGISLDSTPTIDATDKKITYGAVTISDDTLYSASATFTIQGTKKNGEAFGPIIKTQTFSVSRAGRDSSSIRLSATSQAFKVNKYGSIIGDNTITITANLQNTIDSPKIKWKSSESGIKIYDPSGSNEISQTTYVDDDTVIIKHSEFSSSTTVKITATVENKGDVSAGSDEMTFIVLEDGSNVVSAVLSNETHTLSQYKDSNGNIKINPSLSGTSISVYDGVFLLDAYTSSDYSNLANKNGAYYVTATPANNALISVYTTPTISTDKHNIDYGNITILDHTFLRTYIQFDIIGKKTNGEDFAVTKIQTFSVSVRGTDGDPGPGGSVPTFRGHWSKTYEDQQGTLYYNTYRAEQSTEQKPGRADIVYYPTDTFDYWICVETHLLNSSSDFITDKNAGKWVEFGNEFENVATNILLTNDAYVKHRLVIGSREGEMGSIISNGGSSGGTFEGGFDPDGTLKANENYDTAGFRLEKVDDNVALFDVGGPITDTDGSKINNLYSYLRYSSKLQKIEMRGANINNTSYEDLGIGTTASTALAAEASDQKATFIGGGYDNSIDEENIANNLASTIVGGAKNFIKGRYSFVGNGVLNWCQDNFSAIVAGYNNTVGSSEYSDTNEGANFIGAGQNNKIRGGNNQSILGGSNNEIIN